eukprot:8852028-Heterocapsa_arctica.AAC.1
MPWMASTRRGSTGRSGTNARAFAPLRRRSTTIRSLREPSSRSLMRIAILEMVPSGQRSRTSDSERQTP